MAEVQEAEYELYVPLTGDWQEAVQAVEAYNKAPEAMVHRVTPKTNKTKTS